MRKKGEDGYVVAEAAVVLPMASVLLLLLVYLCSYLYQGCFMTQAAYVAAFRGSRYPQKKEAFLNRELDEILERELWSFAEEERETEVSLLRAKVTLRKRMPFSILEGVLPDLSASWTAAVRDPVAYIRGIRKLTQLGKGQE